MAIATALSRRRFVKGGASLLGSAVFGPLLAGCGTAHPSHRGGRIIEPGLQLYTVRALLEENFPGTLEAVAALGYREVQVSPRAGHSARAIRGWLDAAGLACPSIHLDPRATVEAEIEAAHTLGAKTVFLSAPPQVFFVKDGKYGIRDDLNLDTYREIARELDATGARFREAGLVFGYHNHAFEFSPIDGVLPYDVLVDETDPELVALELDLGWAQVGGVDPVSYFERYPGRFPVCHVKDVLADGTFVDPGRGTVDFERIFASATLAGLEHYFVEHDTSSDPLATAAAGHGFLSAIRAE